MTMIPASLVNLARDTISTRELKILLLLPLTVTSTSCGSKSSVLVRTAVILRPLLARCTASAIPIDPAPEYRSVQIPPRYLLIQSFEARQRLTCDIEKVGINKRPVGNVLEHQLYHHLVNQLISSTKSISDFSLQERAYQG